MKTYSEKLKDPRWQRKRLEIMNRDNFTCHICGDTRTTLHVHHRMYARGCDPWEYPDNHLITLCEKCHENYNATDDLISTVRKKLNGNETMGLILGLTAFTPESKKETFITVNIFYWILSNSIFRRYISAKAKDYIKKTRPEFLDTWE